MTDPVLGNLSDDPHVRGCVLASVPYQGRTIDLRVEPDGLDMDVCLGLARDCVASLSLLEAKARAVAATQLLDQYNDHWRTFSRARPDGQTEDVVDPVLSSTEFAKRLELRSIAVTGSMMEFCFGDNGLFAGHSIFVTSFNGIEFTDTDAMVFG